MNQQRSARLSSRNRAVAWLLDPSTGVPAGARPMLYGSLLAAPGVVVIGALSGMFVSIGAALHTGASEFRVFVAIEVALLLLRLRAIQRSQAHYRAGTLPSIDRSISLTIGWCALQGITGFAIAATGDLVMIVIATAFILGLVAPICARNHAAPRLAVMLVMLCDIPFKLGLLLTGQPILLILIPLCLPLIVIVRVLLRNYTNLLGASLKAAEHNRFLAGHDALTGLANRYDLDDHLMRLIARTDRSLALLCLDLDGFKPVNDRYGHAAGDAVLVAVAERLRDVAGAAALVARLGGDEFLLAIPDLSPDDTHALAERVARTISLRSYRINAGEPIAIGVSIGYACFPDDATSVALLRTRADDALYAAKRDGGVQRYAPPPAMMDVA